MIEKGTRGGTCQTVQRYTKANNKYMKNYDKNTTSSYLTYLDVNKLCGWAMSQKLPVYGFECVEDLSQFKEDFIKNYDENSDKVYFLEVDVEYPKSLLNLHKDLPFLPKIKKIRKCNKLVCDFHYKKTYVVYITTLKQALNHGLILKKCTVYVIQFNKKAWIKPYIHMNTELRKKAKNDFEKNFFKAMNNSVFGKAMEHVRKHRDIN